MDANFKSALIAGGVSIVVSLISIIVAKAKIKSEFKILRLQHRQLFNEKLIDLRLDVYPEAFDATQNIGKISNYSANEILEITKAARTKLTEWASRKAGLLLSDKSLDAFYELKDALSKNPEKKNTYSHKQLENIWLARNKFRGSLRDDILLLHGDEIEKR
jgi:hypothetical protein